MEQMLYTRIISGTIFALLQIITPICSLNAYFCLLSAEILVRNLQPVVSTDKMKYRVCW